MIILINAQNKRNFNINPLVINSQQLMTKGEFFQCDHGQSQKPIALTLHND